jgi:hypothetical protein
VGTQALLPASLTRRSAKPEPAEEDKPEDDWLAVLTREQRAVVRSWLDSQEDDEEIASADALKHDER